jgi:PIN domain nuclease of toxin-antitoxin system
MKLLLDTCTFLWLVAGVENLSERAVSVLQDAGNDSYLSSASAWEIGVKYAAKKLQLVDVPHRYVPHYRELHEIRALSLDEESVLRSTQLPPLHKDPFDRMLVAQALTHELTILSPDPLIAQYGVRTIW